jgi:hypothetical protein
MRVNSLLSSFLAGLSCHGVVSDSSKCELLLRQARSANLLSRVAMLCEEKGITSQLPERMQDHLRSAEYVASANHRSVRWEVKQILLLLSENKIPVSLLKGAAYVVGQLEAGKGRVFSDVDILVPKAFLAKTEEVLVHNGWMCTNFDPYDQQYYRTWMHELPPLKHMKRGTALDVHHTIIPPTACLKPDIEKIWEKVDKVEGYEGLYILGSSDLILHSAVHLFHDGELENGLRDLSDLAILMREFSAEEGFWEGLLARSVELDLQRPLFYAFRYANEILKTSIPDEVLKVSAEGSPGTVMVPFMDALFLRALAPDHPSCDDRWTGLARWMLFIRSHWLRMPPLQLAQHLVRKGCKRWTMRNNIA